MLLPDPNHHFHRTLTREEVQAVISDLRSQGVDLGELEEDTDTIRLLKQGAFNRTYSFRTHQNGIRREWVIGLSQNADQDVIFVNMNRLQHRLCKRTDWMAKPLGETGTLPGRGRYMVTEFVPGPHFLATNFNEQQLENLGRAVAELHKAGMDLPEMDFYPRYATQERALGWRFHADHVQQMLRGAKEMRHERWPVKAGAKVSWAALRHKIGATSKRLPRGFTHNDLHASNILFEGNDHAHPRLIDLGRFEYGELIQDIADALVWVCCEPAPAGGAVFSATKAAAFLRGYTGTRPLTRHEAGLLPDWVLGHAWRAKMCWGPKIYQGGWTTPGHERAEHPDELARSMRSFEEACRPRRREEWLNAARIEEKIKRPGRER